MLPICGNALLADRRFSSGVGHMNRNISRVLGEERERGNKHMQVVSSNEDF